MEYIIIIILSLLTILILGMVFKFNTKKIKQLGKNNKLDEIVAEKYPENIEICKKILKKLNTENVKIEENESLETSLYIAITNKILIGNIKNSYTRIQTIAHECLHSIQDRRMLKFNFIFSNIYLLYYAISIILIGFKIVSQEYKMLVLTVFILLAFVFYVVRSFLETDAMTKAIFIAKEYLEEEKISSKEEIKEIIGEYEKLNNAGIKCVNYSLFLQILVKVIIFAILALIF